jgi:hypothetical protein
MDANTYTETQLKIMAILPMISGPLSITGSSLIVFKILTHRKSKLTRIYNRILLGFSICDIIFSVGFSLSTIPSPSGTLDSWGARGNDTTCAIQGFVLLTGMSVTYYNSLLVIYYTLSISFGMSESRLQKVFEPWSHIFIFCMAVVPSIFGICFGMFNNVGNICFVGDYPKGCRTNDEIECVRGEKSYLFFWLVAGWQGLLLFFLLPINLIILYSKLLKQDNKMKQKYKYNASLPSTTQGSDSQTGALKIFSRRVRKSSSHVREARTQAMFYILSSFLCLSWPLIIRIYSKPGGMFILRCLAQFFHPLQGLFNYFNYMRPRVIKIREKKLAHSFWQALHLATFESDDNLQRLQRRNSQVSQFQLQRERRMSEIQNQQEGPLAEGDTISQ